MLLACEVTHRLFGTVHTVEFKEIMNETSIVDS
jgi:hypothetical protein